MRVAYTDSSVLVAIALGEAGSKELGVRLSDFARVYTSNLLEAELRAALAREGVPFSRRQVAHLRWVWPTRSLGAEMAAILRVGYLRGADLWHVATALYVAPGPRDLTFVSLDDRQRIIAARLGFST